MGREKGRNPKSSEISKIRDRHQNVGLGSSENTRPKKKKNLHFGMSSSNYRKPKTMEKNLERVVVFKKTKLYNVHQKPCK